MGYNTYDGFRQTDGTSVIVVNDRHVLENSQRGKQHSPTGHSWGYLGSGCAALAHSMLVHEYTRDLGYEGAESFADQHYQRFKEKFIAPMPQMPPNPAIQVNSWGTLYWTLRGDYIRSWCSAHTNIDELLAGDDHELAAMEDDDFNNLFALDED